MLQRNTVAAQSSVLQGAALIREVEMEVVFGTPSKNCAGAGICLITNRSIRWRAIPCPHTPAIIHYVPGQELVFRFRKRHLSSESALAYFQQDQFLVEEAFRLPLRLVRQWSLPFQNILPGYYPLEEYKQEWRLYFPITPPNLQQGKHEIL